MQLRSTECRLCSGIASRVFDRLVLGKYNVNYFRCQNCGSLFTELPYWLDEAYAFPGIHIDVGMVIRTLKNWLVMSILFKELKINQDVACLDYGGGSGLLTRLMRDTGYNFFTHDQFRRPYFADYFESINLTDNPTVVTTFEVFEHFAEPAEQIGKILSIGTDLVLFTTSYCDDQPEDWDYLVPECGQHVFFYSSSALRTFSDSFGYNLVNGPLMSAMLRRGGFIAADDIIRVVSNSVVPNEPLLATVQHVLYGNEYTTKDGNYARRRFANELYGGTVESKVRSISRRVSNIAARWARRRFL